MGGTSPITCNSTAAGVMTTASGLVFQGDIGGNLRVLDASSGQQLHTVYLGTSVIAAPATYTIGSEQYVALMAGVGVQDPAFVDYRYDGGGRIIALKLGGREIPQRPRKGIKKDTLAPPPIADEASTAQLETGRRLFERKCTVCHTSTGRAPDLGAMTAADYGEFKSILREGSRAERGMPSFGNQLSDQDIETLRSYIVHLGWKKYRCAADRRDSMRTHH